MVSESDPDMPKSLDPRDIKFFIDDEPEISLFKLWQALGINPNEFDGSVSNNPDFFPRKCHNCEAETWEYDFDGEEGNESLLRICDSIGQSCRYLIFKWADKRWKLLGHIDAWGKYQSPQHTVIVNRGVTWLAIRNQGASGTGVSSYIDFVYLVTPRRILKGFSYVAHGSQFGGPGSVGRDFNGRVVDCTVRQGAVNVEFAYSVIYWGDTNLFSQQHKVISTNRLGDFANRFDPARSNITEPEFESVYNIDSLSNEDFLQYNYGEMSQIASGRDIRKKEWLREFLKNCENTAERRRLSQLLARDSKRPS